MSQTSNSSSDDRLNDILAEYLQAVEAGESPDEETVLQQHPEFADQLREFFADKRKIDEIDSRTRTRRLARFSPLKTPWKCPSLRPVSRDKTLKVWDAETGRELLTLKGTRR